MCKPTSPSATFLPTRLIDIGLVEELRPRLTVTATDLVKGPYLTLSYCWGGGNGYKLTGNTIEELKTGLPLTRFPTTIQDAMKVTRKLDFRYIWIDSLCILQDDEDDWMREATSMRDVYANCYLTIAALGAADSGMGLFGKRDPLMLKPCWLFESDAHGIFAYPREPLDHCDLYFNEAKLHSRGWVMQERILSPRTLNFGTSLVWECREKCIDEYGMDAMDDRSLKKRYFAWQATYAESAIRLRPESNDFLRMWSVLLAAYTKAELSFKTDRSIAVSGLVQKIEDRTGWTNFAGLWPSFMVQQLLWTIIGNPQQYRNEASPTWSWWAVDGGISFQIDLYGIMISTSSKRNYDAKVPLLVELATLEEVEVTDADTRPNAKLYTISLTCNMFPIKNLRKVGTWVEFSLEGWPMTRSQHFQADTVFSTAGSCYFVPLIAEAKGTDLGCPEITYGLAVISSARVPGAYERLGSMDTRQIWGQGKSMKEIEQKTIRLI